MNMQPHASTFAAMSPTQRAAIIGALTPEAANALLHDWRFFARPEQVQPDKLSNGQDWQTWAFIAGRGAGKTRSGAETVRENVKAGYRNIGLIAPTAGDIRDVMIEGISGVLRCSWADDVDNNGVHIGRPTYEPSLRHRLVWANGAMAHGYSAEEPDRLRGPNHDFIWADEVAAWENQQDVWDMAMFGLRLGRNPKIMVTTTPKPTPLMRAIIRDESTIITRASTYANKDFLAAKFLARVQQQYGGTRLGRQEIEGELIEQVEGALWQRDLIERAKRVNYKLDGQLVRHAGAPPMRRIVISIDPAITAKAESNLTGIIAAGLGEDNKGYVLEDASGRYQPGEWAARALALSDKWGADRIVAEGNQGGEMVRHTIHTERENASVRIVYARQGKNARAEPVAALYEQEKIHHVCEAVELEDQMCTWEPLGKMPSPDRIDALVWAFTDLMLGQAYQPAIGLVQVGAGRMNRIG